jgi:hypothetical protein
MFLNFVLVDIFRLTTRAKKDEQQWLDDNDDKSDVCSPDC